MAIPLIAAVGCSVIARSAPEQCATDNDCYVKFGGSYACRAGACQVATPAAATEDQTPKTLDECRSTQECVAVRGEGWLCRRDRGDPQKKGKCQQLTATSQCSVVGDYKDDRVVMLAALLPGSRAPELDASIRRGLTRAVDDWQSVARQLAQEVGPDAVAAPRPFAFLVCSEDVPVADLRNLYLNTGVSLVVGPSSLREGATETLANELTNAKLLLVSPTSLSLPQAPGANVASYFFRIAGDEKALGDVILSRPKKPVLIVRRTGAYETLATQIKAGLAPGFREITYDDPTTLAAEINDDAIILGDGEVKDVLTKLRQPITPPTVVKILPSAIPDVAAALATTAAPLGVTIESYRSLRSQTIPATPFPATGFGDAETYDAVYASLIAIATIPDATSPDAVAEETLQKAFLQVTAADAPSSVKAIAPSIRDIVKQLRTTPEGPVYVEGASGVLKMSSSLNTTRAWTACTVRTGGCGP